MYSSKSISSMLIVLILVCLQLRYKVMADVPKVLLNDGNQIPIVGLGTVGLTKQSITDAINNGYRLFDTAYVYSNEKVIGDALNEAIDNGTVTREEIFFSTKVWLTFYGKGRVIKSAQQSIEESGLKYLDLLLLHWPIPLNDSDTDKFPKLPNGDIAFNDYDIIDVYKELEEVKRLGLAKSIGVSNFNSQQIERVVNNSEILPVTNQVECHPYLNQERLMNFCRNYNITLTAYSPLGASYPKEQKINWRTVGPSLLEDENLKQIASKYLKSVAQVLIRWQTQRGVIVIPRSSSKVRLLENISIFDFTLSDEDMALINSLNRNLRFVELKNLGLDSHKEYPFKIDF